MRLGDDLAFHDGEVGSPNSRFLVRARPACCDECAVLGKMLGLDEHLGESRMRVVGSGRSQDQLGVGCELDFTRITPAVGHRQAADLAVVLAGDKHIHGGRQRSVPMLELGVVLAEHGLVVPRTSRHRLYAGRPHLPALRVPQKDERT